MKKVLNLFLQTLHSPDLSPVWQMEREQIYANERQQFLVYFCTHSPGPSCHKNLSSAPYITPCEVFQIHLWVWPWLVTKLQGVIMVGKASKTPGISAHQWRISFGATWLLQGNGEKWTTHYRDAIFCMGGVHAQSGNIFGAGRRPLGEGLGVCYVTAVLQKLTQWRQLLKYLLLSDERFCSVSQHSIWNLTHLSSLPHLLDDPLFKLSRFNSPALLHYRHIQQLMGDLCSF